ncbi:hypothetical protein BDA96_03G361900 [Sorghum bicolor]|uniref:Uncharacterized protein n=1 Tax=Sorghum bicolor TaxID=4558 RepID=A0A921RHS5_SORBI|nr:hypothetical protein BDA96_03G361900 [Sorghum bicolor]
MGVVGVGGTSSSCRGCRNLAEVVVGVEVGGIDEHGAGMRSSWSRPSLCGGTCRSRRRAPSPSLPHQSAGPDGSRPQGNGCSLEELREVRGVADLARPSISLSTATGGAA